MIKNYKDWRIYLDFKFKEVEKYNDNVVIYDKDIEKLNVYMVMGEREEVVGI